MTLTNTNTKPLWESWWGREQWGSCSPSPLGETQRRPIKEKFLLPILCKHIHLDIHPLHPCAHFWENIFLFLACTLCRPKTKIYFPKNVSHLWARVGNPALVALNLDDGGSENAFHAANLHLEANLRSMKAWKHGSESVKVKVWTLSTLPTSTLRPTWEEAAFGENFCFFLLVKNLCSKTMANRKRNSKTSKHSWNCCVAPDRED